MTNLLLFLIAVFLSALLMPFGFVFSLITAFRYKRTLRKAGVYLSKMFREVALSIDRLGNAACGDLFNGLFIKHGGYYFGVGRETVSSALGKNQLRGTLTRTGRLLAGILDAIDPDHCIKSIDEL